MTWTGHDVLVGTVGSYKDFQVYTSRDGGTTYDVLIEQTYLEEIQINYPELAELVPILSKLVDQWEESREATRTSE